ncbi:uncharacterized protein LOC119736792 [Patiria miniata]|uniref:LRRNT domain-containing protein n=1 Tax=Patiria miniata TaxID=46514 RepID=A0A914ATC1_PATMI|nr:uncharacterized protein LOC119736792 [Patiria miniata]
MAQITRRKEPEKSPGIHWLCLALLCTLPLCLATTEDDACHVCECDSFKKIVNCNGKGLKSMPNGIPHDTTLLYLANNQISAIESGAFSGLTSLIRLDLSMNGLTELTPDMMKGVGGSVIGKIYNNELLEIPSRLFYRPGQEHHILTLDFSGNKIQHVAADALLGVKGVQEVFLSSNNIASLPEDLFANVTVFGTLDLSSNDLSSIPDGLLRFQRKLRTLYLHQNFIRVLRREMFVGLQNLRTLMIADNPITEIDERVFSDTQLVNLYLFNAELRSIGARPFMTRANSLLLVSLYGNDVEVIADSVWQDLGPRCNVSIGSTLRRVPFTRSDLNINLVGTDFVQTLSVTKEERNLLIRAGFSCEKTGYRTYQCTTCHQGTYGGAPEDCKPCPSGGFFQNRTGQVVKRGADLNCFFCNNGTYVPPEAHPGKTIGDCVVCPSGTDTSRHAGFRACPCVSNYYRKDRFGECFACPLQGTDCSEEYQHLLPGFWWTWDWGSVDNYQSYEKYVQNILIHNESYDESTVRFKGALPKVHPCPRKESCQNGGDGINATCEFGYEDFLCSQCIANYYSWFNRCFECPRWYVFLLEIVAALVVIVVLIIIVMWDLRRHRRRGRSAINALFSRFKIVLGFYQIMGEIFEALDGIHWPQALTNIGSFFRLLEVNIAQLIVSPRCYFPNFTYPTIYIEFITGMSFVVFVVLLALIVYGCRKSYLKMTKLSKEVCNNMLAQTKQTCYLVVVILLFVTYPSVSSAIFTLLPPGCDEFYLDDTDHFKVLRLRSDYSIDCESNQHVSYNYAAEVSLCYVVGLPLALFLMLWASCRSNKGSDQCSSAPSDDCNAGQPLGCSETDQSGYQNESDLDPKSDTELLCHANSEEINTSEGTGVQSEDVEHDDVTSSSLPESDREKTDDNKITWVSFLCENYKEQFWYWEIVELARKVLQVVFVLMFGADDHFTLFATIVLSVAFLIAHAYLKPMKDAAEHRLQMCSLTTIFLNLSAASLLLLPDEENQSSDARKEFLVVFLIVINLNIVAFVAGSAVWTLVKAVWKTSRSCRPINTSHTEGETTLRLISGIPISDSIYGSVSNHHATGVS